MSYHHGFEMIYEKEIPELNTRARLFHHVKSGAQLLSLENEEENKVFGITFRTPPVDSSGVAHIMEHAVLCGSQKYPVKEPFVELMKGSLNTFLNAMTFPDKTCYPVASQNVQDFYNLIGVYMDAVFHPLISEQAFNQEGWHYELESLDDPLVYKGVVFNEMKGAYSSPESLLGHSVQRSLFPDTTYGIDSGGDPQVIPQLTYAAFKSFHETYYQPANAWIYFFGDDDPDERLRRMDEYLREFDARMVNSKIGLQPAFPEPRRENVPYDASDEAGSKKCMLAVNWLLPETTDTEQTLGLSILAYILIGTHASPLRKALIDSGLGEDLVGAGLENDLRQMYFSTGLKGIADRDNGATKKIDQVEGLIWTTLAELAEAGIDPETVAASLNTVEFRLRENNTGSFPRGLLLMLRCLTTWLYDGDPLSPLAFEAPLQAIKQRLSAGERYFENLICQHFLDNRHYTTVILQPESGLGARQEQAEQKKLADIRDALSVEELQAILDQTRALKLRQETPDTPEALATIPNLKLGDLDRENKVIPCEISELSGSRLLYHDLFTNGIAYIDLGMDLHQLPQEYLPYAALFGRVLLEMGTQAEDFVRLSQRIGRTTGGIRPSYFITAVSGEAEQSRTSSTAWLFLRGKATLEHTGDLFAILHDVLLSARLDNPQRFRQMVLEEKADLEAALTPSGHRLVNMRLHSFFGEAGWVNEQMGGISYLYFLRKLADEVDRDWPAVLARLEGIRDALVNRGSMLANVSLDRANWPSVQTELGNFLEGLPHKAVATSPWKISVDPADQGLAISSQVNFVGKGANLVDLGYQIDGSYAVINNYLRSTYLWEKVRVEGGAYGGFCLFDHRSGVFTYLSYRDPNVLPTLEIFDRTGNFLRELNASRLTDEELTKSIIGAIGDLDAFQLPDAKGYTSLARYLTGEDEAVRQQRREQILSTSLEDFHRFGEALERMGQSGRVVVMGSEGALQMAIDQGRRLVIEKVQ